MSDPTEDFSAHFPKTRGYLSACTAGLPSVSTSKATQSFMTDWAAGKLDAVAIDASVNRCRALFAQIAGVTPDRVAVGSQVSQFASVVATSVADGAEVLCAAGDFASLAHPFVQLQHRGVRVRFVPLDALAAEISSRTALVVFSLVQSATGEVADHAAITTAAEQHGARTCVDLTQSLGWLPVHASHFDYTITHAYKWLCAPRGTAFLTVREGLDTTLIPLAAGWYSAADVWSSCYADSMPLDPDAGRFDVSPAWPSIPGTEAALTLIASLDPDAVHAHAVGLAGAARAALGADFASAQANSAIVTWADPSGADLAALTQAGITASGRAGNARVAFHLWNTTRDVTELVTALAR